MLKLMGKNKVLYFVVFLLVALLSCSEDKDRIQSYVEPGHYLLTFDISTAAGEVMDHHNVSVRNIVSDAFTDVYPYDYVYFHAGDVHLKYELEDNIPDCMTQNCKGIQFDLTVNKDNSYTINKDGETYTIPAGTVGYFSSHPTDEWKGTALSNAEYPLKEQNENIHMLDQDGENANVEIFRSKENFALTDLMDLGEIILTRECAAFRATIIFTNLNPYEADEWEGDSTFQASNWIISRDRLYIKCYMGPMFCSTYSLKEKKGTGDSYYVTNDNRYVQFQSGSFPIATSGGTSNIYRGYGLHSEDFYYLIAPFDKTEGSGYTIDIFVKVLPEGETPDEEFLTSNEGAFYFTATISSNPPEMGKTHWANLIYDEDQLMEIAEMIAAEETNAVGVRSVTTRNGLRWVDIKPTKVITK